MDDGVEHHGPEAEDEARAQWYALVSRLFYAPPDADLLKGLAAHGNEEGADDDGASAFRGAWTALQDTSREAGPDKVKEEFDALFVGAGKAQVTPYTSSYAAPHAPDRHLLDLRNRLGKWGLARQDHVFEVEDHVSALCDAMRWLIQGGRTLEEQRAFFSEFIDPGIGSFCDAIERSPNAEFYRAVARLAHSFLGIEKEAFDLHTAA